MKKIVFVTTILFSCLSIIFANDSTENSRVDTLETINSFSQLGDFHTLEYAGDYEDILDFLDIQFLGGNEQIDEMGCSLFSGLGDSNNIFLGRNFDNPQQDILVGKYSSSGCYESIAVNRLADMGLPLGTDFSNLNPQQELLLLRAPYFACDGINEMGLAVGVAFVDAVPVQVDPNKESIWLTRWIREILDHAANVQEAIEITNNYNILDNFFGQNTICHHLLITDSSGESVILEYHDGAFEEIYPEVDWQVLTNTHIYNHTLQQMFNLCYRYGLLYNALEDQNGEIFDWRNGLDILELPTWGNLTNGTQWSNIYDTNEEVMYLSRYRDFDNIVQVDVENFEFKNYGNFQLTDQLEIDENNNEIIEPGETVGLVHFLAVDFTSTGVVGTISSSDPDIIIVNPTSDFGDINPDEIVFNLDNPFEIEISENAVEQIAAIDLTLTTDYGYEYDTAFVIAIGSTSADDDLNSISNQNLNLQNYPNPFNPSTTITFSLNSENLENIELEIYNLKGQLLKNFPLETLSCVDANARNSHSTFSVNWDGTDNSNQMVSSGIYFSVLKQNGRNLASKKMMLLK